MRVVSQKGFFDYIQTLIGENSDVALEISFCATPSSRKTKYHDNQLYNYLFCSACGTVFRLFANMAANSVYLCFILSVMPFLQFLE